MFVCSQYSELKKGKHVILVHILFMVFMILAGVLLFNMLVSTSTSYFWYHTFITTCFIRLAWWQAHTKMWDKSVLMALHVAFYIFNHYNSWPIGDTRFFCSDYTSLLHGVEEAGKCMDVFYFNDIVTCNLQWAKIIMVLESSLSSSQRLKYQNMYSIDMNSILQPSGQLNISNIYKLTKIVCAGRRARRIPALMVTKQRDETCIKYQSAAFNWKRAEVSCTYCRSIK